LGELRTFMNSLPKIFTALSKFSAVTSQRQMLACGCSRNLRLLRVVGRRLLLQKANVGLWGTLWNADRQQPNEAWSKWVQLLWITPHVNLLKGQPQLKKATATIVSTCCWVCTNTLYVTGSPNRSQLAEKSNCFVFGCSYADEVRMVLVFAVISLSCWLLSHTMCCPTLFDTKFTNPRSWCRGAKRLTCTFLFT